MDSRFEAYPDQWALLASVQRMTPEGVERIVAGAVTQGRVIDLHIPIEDEDAHEPWKTRPSRRPRPLELVEPLPKSIEVICANQLFVSKEGVPPQLVNRLIRVAAFQNPEFYRAQAMRLPTFDKPRIIACAENFPAHVGLPRGCFNEVEELLKSLNIEVDLTDKRNAGLPIRTKFMGELSKEQKAAARALLKHDTGVLSATTGFGKTVIAANIIAKRNTNTLILVHRKQLLEQWLARLQTFLEADRIEFGQLGGGKRKLSGQIDVALIQSLVRKGEVDDCVADYGQLIVDECHHLSAVSFEAVARQCKAKYVLGLSATPYRKDGKHPIIFMQCGPVRHHVSAKAQAKSRPFNHFVVPRYTAFKLPFELCESDRAPPIQTVYAELAQDEIRNRMILEDVLRSLKRKRSPVLLTERKEHVAFFANALSGLVKHVITLQGGMGKKALRTTLEALENVDDDEERVIVATGRYIGEGFDDARLDTLFLAMPISWKGTLAQYAGRLHRVHQNKTEVLIFDYVDRNVPVLQRMSDKRMTGYRNLGYSVSSGIDVFSALGEAQMQRELMLPGNIV